MTARPTDSLRLDRYVATVTDFSRREVKKLIRDGEVAVAGEVVRDARTPVEADDSVTLAGQPLRRALPRYFMLNKPVGHVCANRDRRHPTVLELLMEDNPQRLHVAGRLDIDSTGLVLLTDDGQWSHAVTAPQRECWKRYRVHTAEPMAEKLEQRFAEGIFLADEKARTLPAELERVAACEALVRIREGRYHQVKRMFAACGNAVTALHREAIGAIELDPTLAPGDYRELTDREVKSIQR
jgi:16S rRNA pseudouridine516 synthase